VPGTAKKHKLYVLPECQGAGLGKKLIGVVAATALVDGNTRITLNVKRDNPAINFYKKMGFVITANEDIDIGEGYQLQDYIMEAPSDKLEIRD